jgi:integrase/ribosomal protein L40E
MVEIHKWNEKLKRAEVHLEKSAIPDVNKDLIRRFVLQKTAEKVKAPRLVKYVSTLRLIAERYLQDRAFLELDKEDLVAVVAAVERSALSDWSKHDYKRVLKTFYRWLGRPELLAWLRVCSPTNELQPEDLLTPSDVSRMLEAALNDRDRAFIATLYDGAFRIGEIGGAMIKNVTFERYCARLSVKGKTGRRTTTLIHARPYLARWLEAHPFREDPGAPLWVNFERLPRCVPMEYMGLYAILKRIADRAGITKKINPHLWRHSRGAPLFLELPGPVLEQFMGWCRGSRMARFYQHLADRAADPYLYRLAGLDVPEEEADSLPLLICPRCRASNLPGARVCSSCNQPLTLSEHATREKEVMDFAAAIMDLVATNPEAAGVLQKYVKDAAP